MHWLFIILLITVAGCAPSPPAGSSGGTVTGTAITHGSGPDTNQSGLIVTPSSAVTGKVAFVNPTAQYVVVSYPVGRLPPIGRRLSVYRNGLKVGELKVTPPQRDVNTVADLVAGECRVGDEVRAD